jgi:altronate hydrolase
MSASNLFVHLHKSDNVVVAVTPLNAGLELPKIGLVTREEIPAGHKIALRSLKAGETILKYNTPIGVASADIEAGSHVHIHNMAMGDVDKDYAVGSNRHVLEPLPVHAIPTFQGYRRADGRVGTRNYIGIFCTVNCSATVAHKVADYFTEERMAEYPGVDGVVAFSHTTGCGMERTGEPLALLRRTMGGYARHPNIGAALIIGLGCERNEMATLLADQDLTGAEFRHFSIQEMGGTKKSIEAAIEQVKELLVIAGRARREPVPASELVVGLQCGASDGFSAISANPALGAASDLLVRMGATTILSETPEIYGVEYMLTRRADRPEVASDLLDLIGWWERYTEGRDVQMRGIVSPGNMAGGLTNIVEKSLGAVMKSGTAPLRAVYRYAEQVSERGLVFVDSPGYDPVAVTGQVASGANIVCFTTGRGSAFGCKPTPSLKLASNSAMYQRLSDDMDINCGEVLDGARTIEEMGHRIVETILATASGEPTKSELLDVGSREFVPWQLGVVG